MTKNNISILFDKEKAFLRIRKRGIIRGRLLDANGSPLAQMTVIARNFNPAYYETLLSIGAPVEAYDARKSITTLDGSFEITGLYGGDHRLYFALNRSSWIPLGEVYLDVGHELTVGLTLPSKEKSRNENIALDESLALLEVVINGNQVTTTHQDGRNVIYPQAEQEYKIKLTNKWSKKVLAVLTVDGLSVITGAQGGFTSPGYVMPPLRSLTIPGWRLNNSDVAKFLFKRGTESYASLMQRGENIGVISCAFFEEDLPVPKEPEDLALYSYANRLGTGFGDRTKHQVEEVKFKRKDQPTIIKTIYYVTSPGEAAKATFNPDPFPGCQPPPGWNN